MAREIRLRVALHLMYGLQAAMTPHFITLQRVYCVSQPQDFRANRFVEAQALASRLREEPAATLGYA